MKNPQEVNKFCERLKQVRLKAGLTQDALAFEAEISTRTIQRIEAGTQAITIDLLFSLCRALQMQPADLFNGITIELED